ncbi:MAG: hypothetical protein HUJ58_08720 [Erysipelotrichaceae bacterium]|nr:hypothetical protein [Erysipelotrichaceae bacterium]
MKLKETFRLQTTLSQLHKDAISALDPSYFASTKKTHLLKSVGLGEDVTDEPESACDKPFSYTFDEMVDFCLSVEKAKRELTVTIQKSKMAIYEETKLDIDGAKAQNALAQELIRSLQELKQNKTTETKGTDTLHTKDNEGKPAALVHRTLVVTEYDYNRNSLNAVLQRLRTETNEASLAIDEMMATREVTFNCLYLPDDTFEDAFERFKAQR